LAQSEFPWHVRDASAPITQTLSQKPIEQSCEKGIAQTSHSLKDEPLLIEIKLTSQATPLAIWVVEGSQDREMFALLNDPQTVVETLDGIDYLGGLPADAHRGGRQSVCRDFARHTDS
jgi:hypothetical protein